MGQKTVGIVGHRIGPGSVYEECVHIRVQCGVALSRRTRNNQLSNTVDLAACGTACLAWDM